MCGRSDPSMYDQPKTYTLEYAVEATTYLEAVNEAVNEAGAMLRSGLTLLEVIHVERCVTPGWWNVKMAVREAA